MGKIRVGVVGVGYLGGFHAEKYSRMPDVELVGVADIDRAKAESAAGRFSTTPYSDYRDLAGKADAVSIVVPTPDHFRISRFFLENGVDILIEKPMTATLDEADSLIRQAEKKGLIIQVGHLERFNPAVVALHGVVKRPVFIESHRLSTYQPRGTDVSVVLDLMIHDIDLILKYTESKVRSIHAAGICVVSDHLDIANASLEFENGCVANVTASRVSIRKERKIRFFQKDACISVDFTNHEITVAAREGSSRTDGPDLQIRQLCFPKRDALEDELSAFVKAVRNRETPEVSGLKGRDALKIALDIMNRIQAANDRFVDA
jgi:predicted dehydrogenase